MAIYVRDLSQKEGNQLKHNARKGSNPVKVRRSLVILASAQKMKVPEIAELYHLSPDPEFDSDRARGSTGSNAISVHYENLCLKAVIMPIIRNWHELYKTTSAGAIKTSEMKLYYENKRR